MPGRALLAAGAAVLLLAPLGAGLGFASRWASASGIAACAVAPPAGAGGTGSASTGFSAVDAEGRTITLDQRQVQRAAAIVATGRALNVPARGQLIALMTALAESSLRVLANAGVYPASGALPNDGNGSDHDSLGLFQQRPTAGWGTVADLMDPVWSSRAFYGGPEGPNRGSPRGLLDIDSWQTMDPGTAAQAVQVSDFPERYAVNEPVAAQLLATLTGTNTLRCLPPSGGDPPENLPPGFAGALIVAAASQLGKPYVWGGGNLDGPTGGGFDCSGLVLYAAYQASGGRIRLPHYTGDQIRLGRPVGWDEKQPGDLIFFSLRGARGPHHVAIYVSGDKILHAPRTGDVVRYGTVGEFSAQVMTVRRLE